MDLAAVGSAGAKDSDTVGGTSLEEDLAKVRGSDKTAEDAGDASFALIVELGFPDLRKSKTDGPARLESGKRTEAPDASGHADSTGATPMEGDGLEESGFAREGVAVADPSDTPERCLGRDCRRIFADEVTAWISETTGTKTAGEADTGLISSACGFQEPGRRGV